MSQTQIVTDLKNRSTSFTVLRNSRHHEKHIGSAGKIENYEVFNIEGKYLYTKSVDTKKGSINYSTIDNNGNVTNWFDYDGDNNIDEMQAFDSKHQSLYYALSKNDNGTFDKAGTNAFGNGDNSFDVTW